MTTIEHLSPPGLLKSPAFTQAIAVSGGRTVYIGGQDAVDGEGKLVGGDDIAKQTTRAIANLRACLKAAGGDFHHLVKVNVHIVAGQDLQQAFGAWAQAFGTAHAPPTVTMIFVAALGNPAWLVEVDGIAVIP